MLTQTEFETLTKQWMQRLHLDSKIEALYLLAADGDGYGPGLGGGKTGPGAQVMVGHNVIVVDLTTGVVWDTGPGNTACTFDGAWHIHPSSYYGFCIPSRFKILHESPPDRSGERHIEFVPCVREG
jgi:hypothetical protein